MIVKEGVSKVWHESSPRRGALKLSAWEDCGLTPSLPGSAATISNCELGNGEWEMENNP